MARLSVEEQIELWEKLREVQEAFPYTVKGFLEFAQVCINTLIIGEPDLNRNQADICKYLFGGPLYRMIQAYRGAAKTTLAGIYSVFRLIHNPSTRILIFSQKGDRAQEIAGWVIKIMRGLDFLEFMLPDKSQGDKESVKSFYIHWALKGADKSPSVACCSIEAGAQGARADILIADDIESLQNSKTVAARELLEDTSKEFESINTHGDIIYLGTPQSVESVYNNLPSRGYDIRIWPARYPTEEQIGNYGEYLAPMLIADIKANVSLQTGCGINGAEGKPTCPEMFDEDILVRKEISQGKAKFQLQFMLDTKLTDDGRFPLKLSDLIVTSYSAQEAPQMPLWASGKPQVCNDLPKYGNRITDKFHMPIQRPYDWAAFDRKVMYIDPAGGGRNGDEMGYACIGLVGTFIYVLAASGVPGGYEEENLMKLVTVARQSGVKEVFIEKNYGNGAHMAMLRPLFEKHYPVDLKDDNSVGQKEIRIIDVLEPLLSSHRLVVTPEVVQDDMKSLAIYPIEQRMRFSLFFQLAHITRDKDCLVHDDRLEALAAACKQIVQDIDYDMQRVMLQRQAEEAKRFFDTWSTPQKRREQLNLTGDLPRAGGTNQFQRKQRAGRRRWK